MLISPFFTFPSAATDIRTLALKFIEIQKGTPHLFCAQTGNLNILLPTKSIVAELHRV